MIPLACRGDFELDSAPRDIRAGLDYGDAHGQGVWEH
jgi:hypothetical protein